MSAMWKWFSGVDDAELPAMAPHDDEYTLEAPVALPAHVEEFLAMKSAAEL